MFFELNFGDTLCNSCRHERHELHNVSIFNKN